MSEVAKQTREQRLAELKRDYQWAENEYDVCLARAEAMKAFQSRLNNAIDDLETEVNK